MKSVHLVSALDTVTGTGRPGLIGRVNDQYVEVAKLIGELRWHRHDDEDGLFQVLLGRLRIRFEGGRETVPEAGGFCVVPKGVLHDPVAARECWIVPVETKHAGGSTTPRPACPFSGSLDQVLPNRRRRPSRW